MKEDEGDHTVAWIVVALIVTVILWLRRKRHTEYSRS